MKSDMMFATPCGIYHTGSGKSPSQPFRLVVVTPAVHLIRMVVGTLWMPWSNVLLAMRLMVEQLSSMSVESMES